MAVTRSGWVLRPRTVMELQPLTSQLSPVAVCWLSAQPVHVVVGPTRATRTLDLMMTDIPDLVLVAVVAPKGN